ncbi:hypothetical protein BRADI_1g48632v3 [Brachypodium distachyon]|uniref:Uncharacterized protein n=1 Tax=Brachypodium distachyon TaxID=15368 RepID=A0A2K2DQB5_BRADI|nr:hypothetical protein BRADI_1g48632v3 [Brachypodium distachyon]
MALFPPLSLWFSDWKRAWRFQNTEQRSGAAWDGGRGEEASGGDGGAWIWFQRRRPLLPSKTGATAALTCACVRQRRGVVRPPDSGRHRRAPSARHDRSASISGCRCQPPSASRDHSPNPRRRCSYRVCRRGHTLPARGRSPSSCRWQLPSSPCRARWPPSARCCLFPSSTHRRRHPPSARHHCR